MNSPKNSNSKLSIPQWRADDRPREKYFQKGATSLSDAELIAILLRTGTSTYSAVDIAKQLLHSCDNQLNKLADLSLERLIETNGIGPAKAVTLQAAFELGRRIRSERIENERHIHSSEDVLEIMQKKIAHLRHEEFWVIYLNQAARILQIEQIGKGGLTSTTVDIRLIFHTALSCEATNIIVCHNHPSGSLKPSKADIMLTCQIEEAANFFNINFMDHIILHKDSFYSFQENGKL